MGNGFQVKLRKEWGRARGRTIWGPQRGRMNSLFLQACPKMQQQSTTDKTQMSYHGEPERLWLAKRKNRSIAFHQLVNACFSYVIMKVVMEGVRPVPSSVGEALCCMTPCTSVSQRKGGHEWRNEGMSERNTVEIWSLKMLSHSLCFESLHSWVIQKPTSHRCLDFCGCFKSKATAAKWLWVWV